MIASVQGTVAAVQIDSAVVEVAGVGMLVRCAPATLAGLRVGQQARLATSLVVREDSLTLFGFAGDEERALFELLQSASGVGPKLAQAMLAVHGPDDLRQAITAEDLTALCRVPGIGKKGAQRIVLELKDKVVAPTSGAGLPDAAAPAAAWRDQVHEGLVGLGWAAKDADRAVEQVAPQAGDDPHVPELLRAALRSLAKA